MITQNFLFDGLNNDVEFANDMELMADIAAIDVDATQQYPGVIIRADSGTDEFVERLRQDLASQGISLIDGRHQ
jgi:hypothetical protein